MDNKHIYFTPKALVILKTYSTYIGAFETVNDEQTLYNLYVFTKQDNKINVKCYTMEIFLKKISVGYEHWNDYTYSEFIKEYKGMLPDWTLSLDVG